MRSKKQDPVTREFTAAELAEKIRLLAGGTPEMAVRFEVVTDDGVITVSELSIIAEDDSPGPCQTCKHDPGSRDVLVIKGYA